MPAAGRQSRRRTRAGLDEREAEVRRLRREHAVRTAALGERRALLRRRLAEVEDRLARDPEAKAAAERYRQSLLAKSDAYAGLGGRLDELAARIDTVLGAVREARRIQAEHANAAGGRLETLPRATPGA